MAEENKKRTPRTWLFLHSVTYHTSREGDAAATASAVDLAFIQYKASISYVERQGIFLGSNWKDVETFGNTQSSLFLFCREVKLLLCVPQKKKSSLLSKCAPLSVRIESFWKNSNVKCMPVLSTIIRYSCRTSHFGCITVLLTFALYCPGPSSVPFDRRQLRLKLHLVSEPQASEKVRSVIVRNWSGNGVYSRSLL